MPTVTVLLNDMHVYVWITACLYIHNTCIYHPHPLLNLRLPALSDFLDEDVTHKN